MSSGTPVPVSKMSAITTLSPGANRVKGGEKPLKGPLSEKTLGGDHSELSASLHRVGSVNEQVYKNLLNLAAVHRDWRNLGGQPAFDDYVLFYDLVFDKVEGLLDDWIQRLSLQVEFFESGISTSPLITLSAFLIASSISSIVSAAALSPAPEIAR